MPDTDDHPPAVPNACGVAAALSIVDGTGRVPSHTIASLEREVRRVIGHLGVGGECRVRIAGDGEVAAAHMKHLGVPGTTDVITFDLSDPNEADSHLFLDVDLLVFLDEAERQARAGGVPVERELLLYIVHGVLHCLGHDDHDEDDAAAMHALEDSILTAIGVGPVYRRAAGTTEGAAA
jgi:probable rRNA maturation factor